MKKKSEKNWFQLHECEYFSLSFFSPLWQKNEYLWVVDKTRDLRTSSWDLGIIDWLFQLLTWLLPKSSSINWWKTNKQINQQRKYSSIRVEFGFMMSCLSQKTHLSISMFCGIPQWTKDEGDSNVAPTGWNIKYYLKKGSSPSMNKPTTQTHSDSPITSLIHPVCIFTPWILNAVSPHPAWQKQRPANQPERPRGASWANGRPGSCVRARGQRVM